MVPQIGTKGCSCNVCTPWTEFAVSGCNHFPLPSTKSRFTKTFFNSTFLMASFSHLRSNYYVQNQEKMAIKFVKFNFNIKH